MIYIFFGFLFLFTAAVLWNGDRCKYCGGTTKDWSSKFSICLDCGEKNY